jgi:DUF917 family protein
MRQASRKLCTEFGSIATTCKTPRTGAEVKRWGIPRTITRAIRLGEAVRVVRRRAAFIQARPRAALGADRSCCLERLHRIRLQHHTPIQGF